MYKIYFENRFIIISSHPDQLQNYCFLHKYHDPDDLSDHISSFLSDPAIICLNIYSEDINALWNNFIEQFHFLEASGGIVTDKAKRVLLIKRYLKWDAPKGHFEPCETPELCARREIKEECGVDCGDTLAELSPSYHIYKFNGEYYLKKTYWFLFGYNGHGNTIPQEEEGITQADWIDQDSLDNIKADMWESVGDILSEVLKKYMPHL